MTDKKPKKKNPVGRPSKYKPEYCDMMLEYFSVEPTEMRREAEVKENDKTIKVTYKGGGVDFPSFERFAHNIGVHFDTLHEWKKHHPDFSDAYARCKTLQEDIWRVNALNGNYSSQFSIFLGKNIYGYKDKSEVEQNVTVTAMPTIKLNDGNELQLNVGEDPDE